MPPEGCSSVHFKRLMGEKNAERMLGEEAWIPTAVEAKEAGLFHIFKKSPMTMHVDAYMYADVFVGGGK